MDGGAIDSHVDVSDPTEGQVDRHFESSLPPVGRGELTAAEWPLTRRIGASASTSASPGVLRNIKGSYIKMGGSLESRGLSDPPWGGDSRPRGSRRKLWGSGGGVLVIS
jgi:hypothetical protein